MEEKRKKTGRNEKGNGEWSSKKKKGKGREIQGSMKKWRKKIGRNGKRKRKRERWRKTEEGKLKK